MSRYLITGGTGSLGRHLTKCLVDSYQEIIVFSRDEQKQFQMKIDFAAHRGDIHYILGDVRDYRTVEETMNRYKPDYVIHTAAQKHVQECDEHPMQAVKTNVEGTRNVAKAAAAENVKCACLISTDKAVEPTTLYGMTKYIAERIWVDAARFSTSTRFVGVRYGNVVNSAGSLIPLYQKLARRPIPRFPLTNAEMTRFLLTFDEAVGLIFRALMDLEEDPHVLLGAQATPQIHSRDGLFYIPKLPAAKVEDIAAIFADLAHGEVTTRDVIEGEKIHEVLCTGYCSKDHVMSKAQLYKLLKKENLLP